MRVARILLPLILLAFAACSKSPEENKQGLAVSACFRDSEDNGSELSLQGLWIFDSSSGELVHTASWSAPEQIASSFITIPKGEYLVVMGVNLDLPLKVEGSDSPQTLCYTLDRTSPGKVFTACSELSGYNPAHIVNLDMSLERVMAELTIELKGAPSGLELLVEAVNPAEAFFPAVRNDSGSWGKPSESIRSFTTSALSLDSSFRSQAVMLMPTASGREWSFFHITMTTAECVVFETYIEAPRMDAGARYLMSLQYEEIKSFMHLSSCPISDWTEGWVYEGDITDPTN